MTTHFRVLIILIFTVIMQLTTCYNIQINSQSTKLVKISKNLAPIREGCIVIYSLCDFEGEKKEICGSVADLSNNCVLKLYS